jgi:hypothetical protein
MKIIVDIRNYTNYEYDEYFDGGTPENNPYVVGQVVAIKEDTRSGKKGHWTLGVVLGVITQHEVRTDAHGMVPLEDIRPATINDFGASYISYIPRLKKECEGEPALTIHEHKVLGEDRQESLWFHGKHIATVRKDGRTFIVEATGEQRIYVDKTGKGDFEDLGRHDNEFATQKALKAGLTDEDLLNEDKVLFEMNSWFAIRELDKEGNVADDIAICHKYDEAIDLAVEEMNKPPKALA